MSTTLTLAPPDFQTFLQLCAHKTSTALLRNKKHKCKARTGRTGGRYQNLEGPLVIKSILMDEFIDYKVLYVQLLWSISA